jgi:hypothetical protein
VAGSGPPTAPEPPRAVAELASRRRLGPLYNAQVMASAWSTVRSALAVGAVSAVLTALSLQGDGELLVIVRLAGVLGMSIALTMGGRAAKALAGGDWYLYQRGLVALRRDQLRAVTWSEVSSVTRKRVRRPRSWRSLTTRKVLHGYEVGLRVGPSIILTVGDPREDGNFLGAQLEQLVSQAGIPVSG